MKTFKIWRKIAIFLGLLSPCCGAPILTNHWGYWRKPEDKFCSKCDAILN